jgi:hypothetical protein
VACNGHEDGVDDMVDFITTKLRQIRVTEGSL